MKSLLIGNTNTQVMNAMRELEYDITICDRSEMLDGILDTEYDIAYVTDSNEETITRIAPQCAIVIVAPSCVSDAESFTALRNLYPTKIILDKVDQYREDFNEIIAFAMMTTDVTIKYGTPSIDVDVTREIMPRLLGIMGKVCGRPTEILGKTVNTNHTSGIKDYGMFVYKNDDVVWRMTGMTNLMSNIIFAEFVQSPTVKIVKELGICPDSAYSRMLTAAVSNLDDQAFWQAEYKMDTWILQEIA